MLECPSNSLTVTMSTPLPTRREAKVCRSVCHVTLEIPAFLHAIANPAFKATNGLPVSEKKQLVKARRGQGIFRANVRLNEKACRVTRVSNPNFLRASHIKPWRHSLVRAGPSKTAALSRNGLRLSPHLKRLCLSTLAVYGRNEKPLIGPPRGVWCG